MNELSHHIGQDTDIPDGGLGVGVREIGYLFGMYKKQRNEFAGVLTGKGLQWGGSYVRPQATGYGIVYFAAEMLAANNESLEGKTCLVSGSGNVAQHTAEKIIELGGKVVTLSDSSGFIFDAEGIDQKKLDFVAFPCAVENEIGENDAFNLINNGIKLICEGADMPSSPEALKIFMDKKILFAPAKAANAGGVAVSGLEMAQNRMLLNWSAEEVDSRLKTIMKNIHQNCLDVAERYGVPGNYLVGANIAGFVRVANATLDQGLV
jgi:glutamate dehydrogenase (NADP+)